MLEWNPSFVEETKEQQVWAKSQLRLEEPQVSGFGGWREWFITGILAEEAEENSCQQWIESMGESARTFRSDWRVSIWEVRAG